MTWVFSIIAQTTQPTNPTGPAGGGSSNLLFGLMLMFIVFYFFLFKGDRKRKKEAEDMLKNLKKNDRILTIGGIIGTVVSTKDDEVVVKVDETTNTKMTFVRRSIQKILSDEANKTA